MHNVEYADNPRVAQDDADRAQASREARRASRGWIPGEVGIWVFLLTDMSVFAMFFGTFIYERGQDPAAFDQGREALNTTIGALNTFLLLTASMFVALAVQQVRQARGVAAQRLLVGAGVCGVAFAVNKLFEWHQQAHLGHGLSDGNFFQLYYMLTGIHLLHVCVALVIVTYLWRLAGRVLVAPTGDQARFLENGASYWHLVDLLWLVLFALFYLVN